MIKLSDTIFDNNSQSRTATACMDITGQTLQAGSFSGHPIDDNNQHCYEIPQPHVIIYFDFIKCLIVYDLIEV